MSDERIPRRAPPRGPGAAAIPQPLSRRGRGRGTELDPGLALIPQGAAGVGLRPPDGLPVPVEPLHLLTGGGRRGMGTGDPGSVARARTVIRDRGREEATVDATRS